MWKVWRGLASQSAIIFGGRIAGDQGGIDRPDRGADHPVGLDAGFLQGLVDPGLVGAERSAALEHQDDLAEGSLVDERLGLGGGGFHAAVVSAVHDQRK